MKEKCSRERKQHAQSLEITGSMTCQLHGACARQDSGREEAKERSEVGSLKILLAKLWMVDFILRARQTIKNQIVLINNKRLILITYQESTQIEKNIQKAHKMEIRECSEGCTTLVY